jgi:hypothetical protein
MLVKFKKEELLVLREGNIIWPTQRLKDLMPYVLRKDRVDIINTWIEGAENGTDK